VFPFINDYHNWPSWSPYEKLDPNMKHAYSGPASGMGAVCEWDGNSKAGKGRMEITESVPSSRVSIKLDFSRPMEGHNLAEFTLQSNAGSTDVTWAMSGPMPYVAKVMTVFLDMDKMIGKEFETGLSNLKTAVAAELEREIASLSGAYASFNRGDIDAAVASLDTQIEWSEPPKFPGGGTYHGREGAKQYLTQSRGAWAEVISEPVQFIPAGNRIVVFVHARVRPRDSNDWQAVDLADVYTFSGWKSGRDARIRQPAGRAALGWS